MATSDGGDAGGVETGAQDVLDVYLLATQTDTDSQVCRDVIDAARALGRFAAPSGNALPEEAKIKTILGAPAWLSSGNGGVPPQDSTFEFACHWCRNVGHKMSECRLKAAGAPRAKAKAKPAAKPKPKPAPKSGTQSKKAACQAAAAAAKAKAVAATRPTADGTDQRDSLTKALVVLAAALGKGDGKGKGPRVELGCSLRARMRLMRSQGRAFGSVFLPHNELHYEVVK